MTVDLATLGIAIDTRRAQEAAIDLDRMTVAAARAEAGASRLGGAAGRAGRQIAAADRPVRRATDALSGLDQAAAGAAGQFVALAGAALGLRSLATAMDQYTSMSNILRVMEGEQSAANRALEELNEIASRTRAPLEATVQLYQRMKMAAGELGASQQQIYRFTENIGLALAQQGGSANAASGALMQLSQAMGGGIVRAEEFNSVIEGAYPIALAAARGIEEAGGSVAKLRKMMLEGELTSQEFFSAILSQTDELEAAFATTSPTIAQAMGRMRDSFVMFIGDLDRASGASTAIANTIIMLSDNLDRVAVYAGTAAVAWLGYRAAVAVAASGTLTLAGALTTLRAAIARTGIGLAVVLVGELGFQIMEAVRKAGSFGTAMELMGERAKVAWYGMKSQFAYALADMLTGLGVFLKEAGKALNDMFGTTFAVAGNPLGGAVAAVNEIGSDAYEDMQAASSALGELEKRLAAVNETGATSGEIVLPTLSGSILDAGGAAGKAAKQIDEMQKAADRWRERIEQVGPPIEKYNREMVELNRLHSAGLLTMEEVARAQRLVNEEYADGVPLIGDVADAFGDFLTGGLRDFKGFASSIIDGFRNMISEMIATAARNRIVIGITGGAAGLGGTAAAAGQAGGMSIPGFPGLGLLGQIGGFGSSVLSGITAPLQAALSSATSGGLMAGFRTWNASLNGMASGMNGIGAAIGAYAGPAMLGMGAGSLISGGYSIGGNSTVINGIGTAVGAAILGPIGGLIGGALGGLANRLVGKKLTGQGIGVRFDGESSDGYSYQKYKGGLFSSGGTKERGIGSDMEQVIADAYGELRHSVTGMAETLGIATRALDAFKYSFRFSTKGLSGEEITERLNEELAGVGDAMSELLLKTTNYARAGEAAGDALSRLATSLTGVNSIMDTLGHSFRATGLAGADLASDLADLFGGLDAMTSATQQFYNLFYSEEQRRVTLQRQMTEQLDKLDISMPRTRAAYMALIEAQDLTTTRGQEVYAALIQMAQGMDSVLPSVRNFTAEIAALAGTVTTELQAAIGGAQEAAQTYAQSARLWYQTAQSLRDFIRDLNNSNLAFINPQQALAGNQRRFDALLGQVKGGDVEAAKAITGAASNLLDSLRQTSRTQAEYATAAARVTAGLNLAAGVADLEGANDDVLKSLYEQQIDTLTQLQNFLSYQGLTEDAIKQLPKDLQALVRDFDGTLASFDGNITAIEKAIKEVTSFSYAALQERLNVNLDLIAKADVPDYIRELLDGAQEGITSTIDFIVRDDLAPDLKWLALQSSSEHIKTIAFVAKNRLDPSTIQLALANVTDMTRTINLVTGQKLPPDVMRLALAGNSELSRTVTAVLAADISEAAKRLALANSGSYAVTIHAALSKGVTADLRRMVLEGAGTYSALINAAISAKMSDAERRILLIQQGEYTANVGAILDLTPEARRVMLERAGKYYATIGAGWADLTPAQKRIMWEQGGGYLAKVWAQWSSSLTPAQKRIMWDQGGGYLAKVWAGWSSILTPAQKRILWDQGGGYLATIWSELSSTVGPAQRALLLNANTAAARAVTITAAFADTLSPEQRVALLMQSATISKTISNVLKWGKNPSYSQIKALRQGNEAVRKTITGIIDTGNLTAQQAALLAAVNGATEGRITLGGSFVFNPSGAFSVWYESATQAAIQNPMNNLRVAVVALREAMIANAALTDRESRVSALNSYVSGLASGPNGSTFANDKQIADMARITGINTRGMGQRDIQKALNSFSSDDLLSAIAYDPTGRRAASWGKERSLDPYRKTIAAAQAEIFDLMERYDVYLEKPNALGILPNGAVKWTNGVDFLRNGRKLSGSAYSAIFGDGGPWDEMWDANKAFYARATVPAFANGGGHVGGLRLVGERGPELEATGPARIYSSGQTRNMLSQEEVVAELKALREENRQLQMSMNQHLRQMAQIQKKWDRIGQPPEQAATGTAA